MTTFDPKTTIVFIQKEAGKMMQIEGIIVLCNWCNKRQCYSTTTAVIINCLIQIAIVTMFDSYSNSYYV